MFASAVVAAIVLLVPACGGDDKASTSPAAKAVHVNCGETITVDTTLDNDVVNCPNNGIVIGADDITLDLNGHTVAGNGQPVKPCPKESCDVGLLNDGHDGVAVRNGSVRDFEVGLFIGKARDARVLRISSSRNLLFGIVVDSSARSLVRSSSASGNVGPDGDGMGVFGSHHVRILHNSFRGNGQLGIHVAESSTHILIDQNVISSNPTAIALEANRNEVSRNLVSRNGNGIGIEGNRNVVRENRVDRSRGDEGGFGIPLARGDHNLIARNSIRDTQASAISVGFEPGAGNVVRGNRIRGAGEAGVLVDSKGRNTLVLGNVIRGAAEDGVLVKSSAKQTVLRGNHSFGAKDDGIDVGSTATTLTGNAADRNDDLGIDAVPGVTDSGRNNASGNGNSRQCKNVRCIRG